MLPIRLGVVAGIAAVSLWGLFSLLESLKEPGLLRTEKATVVKGCEKPDSDEEHDQCASLFCQKALLDARVMPLDARFELKSNERYEDGVRVITGQVAANGVTLQLMCDMQGMKVVEAGELIDEESTEAAE